LWRVIGARWSGGHVLRVVRVCLLDICSFRFIYVLGGVLGALMPPVCLFRVAIVLRRRFCCVVGWFPLAEPA